MQPNTQTNQALEQKVRELEEKVLLLMQFMEEKKRQQISFPLDATSQTIIRNLQKHV